MRNTASVSDFEPVGGPDAVASAAAERLLDVLTDLSDVDAQTLTGEGLLHYMGLHATATRFLEGRQIGNVGDIVRRSGTDAGFDGVAARHGSWSATALFDQVTGVKNSTAHLKYATPPGNPHARVQPLEALPGVRPQSGFGWYVRASSR
ncbi:hypothetical protein [Paramicrobacterium chengjingii]|uniref:hypothetical protein n=1 Tax=Paramicrobacterium chengjingii TaxID=2769067 RepID=UPI001420E631|nr:hypothetical protein [Microbacterium chengjingii]